MLKAFATALVLLVLVPSVARATDPPIVRSLGDLLCNALKGTSLEREKAQEAPAPPAPPPPLRSDSIVIDTNIAIDLIQRSSRFRFPDKIAGRARPDVRVAPHVVDELYPEHRQRFERFSIDPATAAERRPILQELKRLNVGEAWVRPGRPGEPAAPPPAPRANAHDDRMIVAEVLLAARSNPLERPVFMTHDSGIYMHLLEASRFKDKVTTRHDAIERFYPNGFEATILGRKILVVPVPAGTFPDQPRSPRLR
ncbi:MAG TPA: hypothetical protein VM598_01145 [Bdellovibrionota bacterium]|nr:hypothetical protein [Bdellovibrionota bacterium]